MLAKVEGRRRSKVEWLIYPYIITTMASFFKSLSDDMEKVAQVLEEGYQILSGAATQMGEASSNIHTADSAAAADFDGDELLYGGGEDIDLEDMEEYGSPLMGMADSVMSDIMSYQVR
jgi:hypothetical protein